SEAGKGERCQDGAGPCCIFCGSDAHFEVLLTHASSSPFLCRETAGPGAATPSPVCSVFTADSKCIRTSLHYTDSDGIRAASDGRVKRRDASRAFLPCANSATGGRQQMTIKQALFAGTALGFAMLAPGAPITARAQQAPAVAAPTIDGDD